MVFSKNFWRKPISLLNVLVQPWSGLAHSPILGGSMRLRYSPPLLWRIQGRGPGGGAALPPPPLFQGLNPALYWVGACVETFKAEPMVPPASSDFWKAP